MEPTTSLSEAALLASRFINQTNRNIFLTGKAGTGKTTFLRHIIQNTHKKAVIAAPTGIAAINAGGVTLHSLFQLPFGSFIPKHQSELTHIDSGLFNNITTIASNNKMHATKRQLLREIELLIIDEVSMLRADILDAIDTVLRVVRRKNNTPFGGVQVLFIGDLLQLPPVIKDNEWYVLRNYYKSVFFFDAVALTYNKPVYIELDKIYRQSDSEFIDLLNNLRNNTVTEKDVELLNKHYKPGYLIDSNDSTITLTTHNNKADAINKAHLEKLSTPLFSYDASVEDDFSEFSYPVEKTLHLKVGAQVMFIKNDYSGNQRYFNGKIATVSNLSKTGIEVKFEDGKIMEVEKYEWENKKYALNSVTNEIDEDTIGKFIHYPIKLAWAITVHKSQGLTFDKAIIDVGQAFAPGQVYVALSRLRTLGGLTLTTRVNYSSISADISVSEFSTNASKQENPDRQLEEETMAFLKHYLLNNFDFAWLANACNEHVFDYKEGDKKSIKSKYYKWAKELKENTNELKNHADKFLNQINRILTEKQPDYLQTIFKRVNDATNYFEPLLKKSATGIFNLLDKLKDEKKIKQYAKELQQLEVLYFEQIKRIKKAVGLCNAIIQGQEFSKKESEAITNIERRIEEAKVVSDTVKEKKASDKKIKTLSGKSKTKSSTEEKPKKIDTKEISFNLFKQGKTIEEIAAAQGFTTGTIEYHLLHYLKLGKLKVEQLVSSEKVNRILKIQKELDTTLATPIKQLVGDDISYGEIKFALSQVK
ncbi:MAG: helix-turn-helix domain-containing protein [Bacteroidota bacterium]|nr:helix-turn-helix domain-containing protein [Bacteroidota bacterium]